MTHCTTVSSRKLIICYQTEVSNDEAPSAEIDAPAAGVEHARRLRHGDGYGRESPDNRHIEFSQLIMLTVILEVQNYEEINVLETAFFLKERDNWNANFTVNCKLKG